MRFSVRDPYLSTLRELGPFRHCSEAELRHIGRLASPVRFTAGSALTDDEVAGCFFVVVEGHLAVVRDGHLHAVVGPGGHFGEELLLEGSGTSVSALALSAGTMLVMARRELLAVLRTAPEVAIYLLGEALARP